MPPKTSEKWHVGKEIPIALLFAMLAQTGGWIWWAATMSAKIDNLSYQVASITAGQYTQSDASKDKELYRQQFADMDRRLTSIENRRK